MDGIPGKRALVAGAASGIGAAVARALHAEGAHVLCADRDLPGARALASSLAGSEALLLDVRDEPSWERAVSAACDGGPLGILVDCAGISAASPLAETELAEWRNVLAVNLDGAFLATKHGIRAMREQGGAIVHVGSASGIRAAAGAAAYSASKAGLSMLVRAAAKECRASGIPVRVNAVSPAGVKTAMWRSMPFFRELVAAHGSEDAAFAEMTRAGGGTFLEPAEVARVVCFLASDAARHVTGVELPVDDGFVL